MREEEPIRRPEDEPSGCVLKHAAALALGCGERPQRHIYYGSTAVPRKRIMHLLLLASEGCTVSVAS